MVDVLDKGGTGSGSEIGSPAPQFVLGAVVRWWQGKEGLVLFPSKGADTDTGEEFGIGA